MLPSTERQLRFSLKRREMQDLCVQLITTCMASSGLSGESPPSLQIAQARCRIKFFLWIPFCVPPNLSFLLRAKALAKVVLNNIELLLRVEPDRAGALSDGHLGYAAQTMLAKDHSVREVLGAGAHRTNAFDAPPPVYKTHPAMLASRRRSAFCAGRSGAFGERWHCAAADVVRSAGAFRTRAFRTPAAHTARVRLSPALRGW